MFDVYDHSHNIDRDADPLTLSALLVRNLTTLFWDLACPHEGTLLIFPIIEPH